MIDCGTDNERIFWFNLFALCRWLYALFVGRTWKAKVATIALLFVIVSIIIPRWGIQNDLRPTKRILHSEWIDETRMERLQEYHSKQMEKRMEKHIVIIDAAHRYHDKCLLEQKRYLDVAGAYDGNLRALRRRIQTNDGRILPEVIAKMENKAAELVEKIKKRSRHKSCMREQLYRLKRLYMSGPSVIGDFVGDGLRWNDILIKEELCPAEEPQKCLCALLRTTDLQLEIALFRIDIDLQIMKHEFY